MVDHTIQKKKKNLWLTISSPVCFHIVTWAKLCFEHFEGLEGILTQFDKLKYYTKYDLKGRHDLERMTIHYHGGRIGAIILLKLRQHLLLSGITTYVVWYCSNTWPFCYFIWIFIKDSDNLCYGVLHA